MIIQTISDRRNVTQKNYLNQPMHMCERVIKMIIAKNPRLINVSDRNKSHSLLTKVSQNPFNK